MSHDPIHRVCDVVCIMAFIGGIALLVWGLHIQTPPPDIKLASMNFTVLNITENRLSANWDLSISLPDYLPGYYICLQGDVQASLLYKNVTLATSSPQKYYNLFRDTRYYNIIKYHDSQLIKVSALVSGENISGSIGKDIIEDIKIKKEVHFTSLFSLTDCRKKATGVINYACHEATLRFEPGSEMKANVFGKHPKKLAGVELN
ncbi:PREDICTED: uncharacterized protein LOC104753740 [Camelina sativa]|uniref:Uncharacterized protein LOC104753740 n=1 Tax=Camelina sativa TaxID=90675 RepID=A0ABM0WPL3_CAMSA|nr:PREDICTED: uncharacterized protein LOC104753740 [Camelina sativa]